MTISKVFRPCQICDSSYRNQIEVMLRKKIPKAIIARKYLPFFPQKQTRILAEGPLTTHKNHLNQSVVYKPDKQPDDSPHQAPNPITLEKFAQRMLNIGGKALDYYEKNPQLISFHNVIAAQRVVLEKKKIKITEDSMRIALSKFFGGFLSEEIDGEIIDEESGPALLNTNKE